MGRTVSQIWPPALSGNIEAGDYICGGRLPPVAYGGFFWEKAYARFKEIFKEDCYQGWFDTFAPAGRAPRPGELFRLPDHARTLASIGETGAEIFYRGELAERIASYVKEAGGYLEADDLAAFKPEWVQPISVSYRGYDVWEIPPNGQGLVTLMALNMMKGFDTQSKDSVIDYHRQIEAMKLAFADGQRYITDSRHMKADLGRMLSEEYASIRRQKIGDTAIMPEAGDPSGSGTVYLAAADGEGNMVSFIQSNYMGFGSGLVVPGTGVSLQNRGSDFSLDESHDNRLEPGKRTYHTIIPGFLTKDGQPVGPFGVMGGYMQPQGHLQVVMNTIDYGLHPQAALDAPRWQWTSGKTVHVEPSFPNAIAQALARRGHDIRVTLDSGSFGRGQIIWRDPSTGVLCGGTESRTDGTVAAW